MVASGDRKYWLTIILASYWHHPLGLILGIETYIFLFSCRNPPQKFDKILYLPYIWGGGDFQKCVDFKTITVYHCAYFK